jgi:sarcosine oxidase subunit gamma
MGYDATITQLPLRALFDLQGEPSAIGDWCGDALPAFPERPNSVSERDGRTLIWTGPDHWLLSAPLGAEAGLSEELRPDDAPADIGVTALSDTVTFFAVTGPDAGAVMAVATPLDLHPDTFPADAASWTESFGTKALIRRIGEGYEIAVDRSYSDWFGAMLDRVVA